MQKKLFLRTKESFSAVMPITIIVLILNFTLAPMPFGVRSLFLAGAFLLIIGMGLFTLGADMAMMPMGEQIGGQLTKSRKIVLLVAASLIMGITITIAEPDLQVLAEQVSSVPNMVLVLAVALGVGIFLVLALLRILFQWKLSYLLIGLYICIFILATFVPEDYLAVAFDSGGVTTGPITVPFILALGVGVCSVVGGKSSHDDSFGLVALCSIGPILAVMLLGIFYKGGPAAPYQVEPTDISTMVQVFDLVLEAFPKFLRDVALALAPILIFFLLFQIFALKLPKSQLTKMGFGIFYTFFGLVFFLTGVNIGFLPAGEYIGNSIGHLPYNWVLIPIGALMGFFVVQAEPAVHLLNDQVEDMTGGAISKNMMMWSMSVGVAASVGIAMIRVLFGVSIWYFILPGYALALILTFFAPKVFTAIAFDSGGVASGPMTATFILPFAMGACSSVGGDMLADAFGIVAMVAMTPLITIQTVGVVYKMKLHFTAEEEDDAMEDIADILEDAVLDWPMERAESDIAVSPAWLDNTEYVENIEWAQQLHEDELYDEIISDDEYIDFESDDTEDIEYVNEIMRRKQE